MWLLNVDTLELHEFVGSQVPAYAILSHVWGAEEVSFSEMRKAKHRAAAQQKAGFAKIEGCSARAREDGAARSSAELSEAINSMFQWYRGARVCYVFLSDVSSAPARAAAEELGAQPMAVVERVDPRGRNDDVIAPEYLLAQLSTTTGIPENVLSGKTPLGQASVAQRMHWASRRETTRPEDRAYSLMGLFDISMPILYGEGLDKAFTRLQYEIMSRTADQSILAWYSPHATTYRLLAESPDDFRNSGRVQREGSWYKVLTPRLNPTSFFMTSLGLRINLPIADDLVLDRYPRPTPGSHSRYTRLSPGDTARALLHCGMADDDGFVETISLALILLDCDSGGASSLVTGVLSDAMSELASQTGVGPDELHDDLAFVDIGVDSLMSLTLSDIITRQLGTDKRSTSREIMLCRTVGELKEYLTKYRY
ncbi:hypothetical protein B0T22DRAFT_440989 [Podospora appendiculata]|uniref:Carrier domain-containing protein n=1 Tax=Podospora appendiculata TaxID=314037 RepID=A0AAE0WYI7_9PEZI|nr:hypothetical protein B0T22DRAFT_446034 [Podospora appendiculata]KAK3689511.1 hypothetical protein B0T22DRAFT_440989 [Podospora appendiculata]